MHFVDDIDFIAAGYRRISDLFAQIADLVHAVVGSGVDLHHVERRGIFQRAADFALPARRTVYGRKTVDRPRENARGRGFARSARTAKQVRVPDLIRFDLVDQRSDDMILPDHLVEGFRTVFSVNSRICHIYAPSPLTILSIFFLMRCKALSTDLAPLPSLSPMVS